MSELRLVGQKPAEAVASSEAPVVDIHDRVAEAYYGRLGAQFMRNTQRRVHWICAHVRGTHILDVGCSQGIVPILLGREGKRVTGIDVDPQAIVDARRYLGLESVQVQGNVTFLNADAATQPVSDTPFDTVVMSEVLEHLVQPWRLVRIAADSLAPGGRLVVTVPFGINDFIDHKHTFYLLEPYRLIAPAFEIVEVTVLGKWIGVVADRREADLPDDAFQMLDAGLVQKLESAFVALERELRDDLVAARQRFEDSGLKYRASTEQAAQLKQLLEDATAQLKSHETEIAAHKERTQALERDIEEKRAAFQGAETQRIRLETELTALNRRMDEANLKYRASAEQVAQLKQRLEGARLERHAREDVIAKMQDEAETLRAKLNDANEKYRASTEQVAQLKQRLDSIAALRQTEENQIAAHKDRIQALEHELKTQRDATGEAGAQRTRLEAELASTSRRLDEANHKYRASTEQVALLKQHLGTVETERKRDEQALRELREQLAQAAQALTAERNTREQAVIALNMQLQNERAAAHETGKRLLHLESEAETLHAKLNDANEKYRASTEQVAQLKQRLATAEVERQANEYEMARLQAEAEEGNGRAREAQALTEAMRARLAQAEATGKEGEQAARQLRERLTQAEQILAAERSAHRKVMAALDGEQESVRAAAREVVVQLEQKLAGTQAAHEAAQRAIAGLQQQLAGASARQTELLSQLDASQGRQAAANEELSCLRSENEVLRAGQRDQAHELERSRVDALRRRQAIADVQREIERLRQQKLAAEHQAVKTRATLSFRLGNLLIFGFKSFHAFAALPGQLWALRREARRKRAPRSASSLAPRLSPAVELSAAAPPVIPEALAATAANPAEQLKSLKVAAVMDEFTHSAYRHECNLLSLTPQHWRRELEDFSPQLLFVESAWRGKDELWAGKVSHTGQELVGAVEWCRAHRVPTVFWNKEDPVHFETFLNTAKLFDYIFTTDIDCIHRYKSALGHDRVYLLPFACQPSIHNPIETYGRKDAFCFAGAYYARYPERCRDLGNIVGRLAEFRPVEIYDRNHGKDDPNYQFPPEYRPFIVGNLPFDQIDKAYKGYRYAINLNSIKQSQSMFARRVFELLACNTLTVSNFSRGLRQLFGDLVVATDDGNEIARRLAVLTADEVRLRKLRLAALRKVMQEHAYQDRLAYVVSKVRGRTLSGLLPDIAVTACAKNQDQFDTVLASFGRQTYANKTLIVAVAAGFSPANAPGGGRVRVIPLDALREFTVEQAVGTAGFVAGMVPDDYYGPNYLLDLALATRYSDAPVVGKTTHYVRSASGELHLIGDGSQYRVAAAIPARAALVKRSHIGNLPFCEWATTLYPRQIEAANGLAVNEFNYCRNGVSVDILAEQVATVDDLPDLDTGMPLAELTSRAERIAPQDTVVDECPAWAGDRLAGLFRTSANKAISLSVSGTALQIDSSLPYGEHEYVYASTDLAPAELEGGAR